MFTDLCDLNLPDSTMIKIAIFASGSGSNAAAICDYFKGRDQIKIALIVTNNPHAGVIDRAVERGIPTVKIDKARLISPDFETYLKEKMAIDYIVLAGFLKQIPSNLISAYRDKILNIHPSLLPKYGGKGMYGMRVHRAVSEAKEEVTGLTIHLVDEEYDRGRPLFQKKVAIAPGEDPESIAAKVLKLEHYHYPRTIEQYILT